MTSARSSNPNLWRDINKCSSMIPVRIPYIASVVFPRALFLGLFFNFCYWSTIYLLGLHDVAACQWFETPIFQPQFSRWSLAALVLESNKCNAREFWQNQLLSLYQYRSNNISAWPTWEREFARKVGCVCWIWSPMKPSRYKKTAQGPSKLLCSEVKSTFQHTLTYKTAAVP